MLQSQKNMSSDVQILQPQGILDGTKASQFRQDISRLVEKGAKTILIDFQDVTFMDSSGIAVLLKTYKRMQAAGGRMWVEHVPPQPLKVLDAAGLDRIIKISAEG